MNTDDSDRVVFGIWYLAVNASLSRHWTMSSSRPDKANYQVPNTEIIVDQW